MYKPHKVEISFRREEKIVLRKNQNVLGRLPRGVAVKLDLEGHVGQGGWRSTPVIEPPV